MKPLLAIVTRFKIIVGDVLYMLTAQHHPRLIISAQIFWCSITLFSPAVAGATTIIGLIDLRFDRMVLAVDGKIRC
jgi:hypothetical protein